MRWAALLLVCSANASAQELRVTAYPETLRFDLRDGRFLSSGRADGPTDPAPYGRRSPLSLRAVRDELVAVQLAVTGNGGQHPVQVQTPVDAEGRASPIVPALFQARGIEIERSSHSGMIHSLGPGLYPDPLIPTSSVTVPVSQGLAVLWLEYFVPQETAPGDYVSVVKLGSVDFEIRIEVLEPVLPRRDVARLGAVNFGSLLELGQKDLAAQRAWMQLAHAHHLSIEIMRPTPKVAADGSIEWNEWARHIGPYIDGTAFTKTQGYHGPRAGLPTSRWVLPLTDWWPSKATPGFLPSDPEGWSKALAAWENFAQSKGWFDLPESTEWILFINSLDEPKDATKLEAMAAYAPLLANAKLAQRSRVQFRVDGNFGQPIPGWSDERQAEFLGGVVDLWNLHGAPYTMPWALVEQRRAAHGEQLMYYVSNSSGEPAVPPLVVDSPLEGARAWGWIVWRYGLSGALNWEVDTPGCVENPQCSPGGGLNLDAVLIYRGEELGVGARPIPSMRLKALRRGAQDAALLALLAERDPDAARKLSELMIPRALGDQVPEQGPGAWPLNPADWDRARDAILDRLSNSKSQRRIEDVRRHPEPQWLRFKGMVALGIAAFVAVLAATVAHFMRTRRGLANFHFSTYVLDRLRRR